MERKEKIEGCLYGGTAGNAMYAVLMLDSASAIIPGRDAGNMSCHEWTDMIVTNVKEAYSSLPDKTLQTAGGDNGCTALAMVTPLALSGHDSFTDGLHIASLGGEIIKNTHRSPSCFIPASIFAYMIFRLVEEPRSVTREKFMDIIRDTRNILPDFIDMEYGMTYYDLYRSEVISLYRLCDKAIKLACAKTEDCGSISEIGEAVSADKVLTVAVYSCLRHFGDFQEAVRCAAESGGDSGATGFAAGCLTGLITGPRAIPDTFKYRHGLNERITSAAEKLFQI